MAIRRRTRRRIRQGPAAILLIFVVVGAWWVFSPVKRTGDEPVTLKPILTTNRPEVTDESPTPSDVAEKGSLTAKSETRDEDQQQTPEAAKAKIQALIDAGKAALARNELVPARQYFSEALQLGPDDAERTLLRAELTRLGNETIFSGRIFEDDPYVDRYVIKTGDTLGKIAKAGKVTAALLAEINGIRDVNLIRAGQTIKTIRGPFHAVVETDSYTMGVYLENTFVKQFRVGLGADQSTPTGRWRVSTKLINPTYYPPRGGQIVAADDPENPLGERWIGLVGVSGEAVGQLRYGIHGTVEPESIGKSVSLGCIRLFNEDVEALYNYLVEEHSLVTVK